MKKTLDRDTISSVGTAKKGAQLKVLGRLKRKVKMFFAGTNYYLETRPLVIENLTSEMNISMPFMKKNNIIQDHSKGCITYKNMDFMLQKVRTDKDTILQIEEKEIEQSDCAVYVTNTVKINPRSARFIEMRVPDVERNKVAKGTGIVSPFETFQIKYDGLVPCKSAIVKVNQSGRFFTSVLNVTDKEIEIKHNARFGSITMHPCVPKRSLPKNARLSVDKIKELFQLTGVNTFIKNNKELEKVVSLIQKYEEVFSMDGTIGKTNLIEHHIETGSAPPAKDKFRNMNPEVERQLEIQIDKWLKQDIIKKCKDRKSVV